MLSVITLKFIILTIKALNVIMLSVLMPMLSVIALYVIMLHVNTLNIIILSVFTLIIIIIEYLGTQCHYAKCPSVKMYRQVCLKMPCGRITWA
jgi:hypothetical protein